MYKKMLEKGMDEGKIASLLYFFRQMYRSIFGKNFSEEDLFFEKDKDLIQVLEIVYFIYSDKSHKELLEIQKRHQAWGKEAEMSFMKNLYAAYKDICFEYFVKEKVGENTYYYDSRNLKMSEEVISFLKSICFQNHPIFVEMVDGEIVFS